MKNPTKFLPAICLFLFVACSEQSSEKAKMVNPPVPKLDPVFQEFELNAGMDTVLLIHNSLGTSLNYRAHSLRYGNGNMVTGLVKFRYREFHDVYSTFLAGIPMNYTENGQREFFETAGMFELRAYKENEPVFIADGKSLGLQFGGKTPGDDFPFFFLDEESETGWKILGSEPSQPNTEKQAGIEEIERMKKQLPHIPFQKGHFVFNYGAALDVYFKDDYVKIRNNYQNAHIKNKIKNYGLSWVPAYPWESIVYKGNKYPAMMMVWKKISEKPFPAWSENAEVSFKKINGDVYEILFKEWGKDRKATITAEVVMPLKSLFAFSSESWQQKYDEQMDLVMEEEERVGKMAEVFRYFELNNFGIYNYDKFINTREAIVIAADFSFDEPINIQNDLKIFCSLSDGRGLMTFNSANINSFPVFNNSEMRIFTVLPPNKIAVFPPEKLEGAYSEIQEKGLGNYIFKLNTVGTLERPGDLELALNLLQ